VQGFVDTLRECVSELNKAAQIEESLAGLVGDSVTQGAYPVLCLARRGDLEQASHLLVSIWKTTLEALEQATEPAAAEEGDKPKSLEAELEYLSALNVAVSEVLRLDGNQAEGRNILRQLAGNLELSLDELGRMFGVSGETVRRWERGTHRIPTRRIAKLISAGRSLSRLHQMFRSNRLPQVIRREAELFGGERALDWILRGRHADVADRYENGLMYQA
jgi:transcriptional regulator with XRE-family HTH domain